MKPWNAWFASLGMAVLCMTWVGCGGSSASNTPSNEANPAPVAESEPTPAEPAPTVAEPAPTEPAPTVAAPAGSDVAATSEPAAAEAKPADSASADANKTEGPSATAAMLAAANSPTPSPAEPIATGGTALAAASPVVANPTPAPAPPPAAEPAPPPGAGNAAAKGQKADFHTHYGAVVAFLNALKAKDPVLLREATALRAPTEARPKNQPLFTAILEQSLSEDELTELASKLEGFQIADANAGTSTGRFSYILMKPGANGSTLRRTITARHEKKGWKVVDISGQGEVEKPLLMPRMGGRGGGGRR